MIGPPYRFEVRYDETIVRQAAWQFARRRLGGRWGVWCLVLLVSAVHVVLIVHSGEWTFVSAVLAALWIILIGLSLAGWLMHRQAAMRKLKALDAMRASLAFEESGVTMTSPLGSTHLVWAALEQVRVHERFWIVATAANSYFTLPLEGAPPAALDFARAKLGGRLS
ncbi:hypothetical protein GCM10007884_24690 [Methylobacterium brachythecii]|uniref:YcxB-like protein domain-containing protein n=1 Tax=Methylobacterium brachythecii TaxID=1176177 RepID=A0ABQ6D5P9_9HYPH|nr:hypothetical protein GCM10007884_24690 [Methylobacterium brachythecii]